MTDDQTKKYIEEPTLFGHNDVVGFGNCFFCIKEVNREIANRIIIKNHYSKKVYAASYIHLGVYIEGELLGILQFGYAMNPASQSSVVCDTGIDEYLELNRMWIDDKAGRNTESKAISYCIKYIKRKYQKIKCIQSFADERCGCFGIVYQASNFKYYGEHKQTFWTLNGETYHNSLMTRKTKLSKKEAFLQENKEKAAPSYLRQFRYIYFIDKKYIKKCLLKEKPYEKHYAVK